MEYSAAQQERLAHRGQRRFSDFEDVTLPDLPDIPGMISPGESRYLYWLISEGYLGAGTIIEIGTWLGRSTVHLAAGLRASGVSGMLHSFDNFLWAGASDTKKSGINLKKGDNFRSYFEQNIAPFKPSIEITAGNFEDYRWNPTRLVEVLFLDAPKDAASLSTCLTTFSPALIPGVSMIVSQDYQHPLSYDLPLAFDRLADKLEMLHAVDSGGTVGFFAHQPLTASDVARKNLDWRTWSEPEVAAAWDRILGNLEGRVLQRLKSAAALHWCELGALDRAVDILRTVDFDSRLHAGWANWGQVVVYRKKYGPLFDLYEREMK